MNLKKISYAFSFLFLSFTVCMIVSGASSLRAQNLDDAPAGYYKHPDPETTAILNFQCGQQKLPPDIRAEAEVKTFVGFIFWLEHDANESSDSAQYLASFRRKIWSKYINLKNPEDFLAYRQSQGYIDDVIEAQYYVMFHDRPSTDMFEDLLRSGFIHYTMDNPDSIMSLPREQIALAIAEDMTNLGLLESGMEYSRVEFEATWKLHQEHGNPKIRFSEEFSSNLSFGNRAYYEGGDNTLHIGVKRWRDPWELQRDWKAELAHSDQYQHHSRSTMYLRHRNESAYLDSLAYYSNPVTVEDGDLHTALKKAQEIRASLYDQVMYSKEDSLAGFPTIEHEAHFIIQPELEKEYEKLIREAEERIRLKEYY